MFEACFQSQCFSGIIEFCACSVSVDVDPVGDFFGERALITGEPRNATIVAEGPVEAYALGKDDFQNAMNLSASFKDQLVGAYFQRQ